MSALVIALFACVELATGRTFQGTPQARSAKLAVLAAGVFDYLFLWCLWRFGSPIE